MMGMMGGGGQNFILNIKEGFCKSCTVFGGRVKVLLADGKTEGNVKNGIYIHHVLTFDTKKKTQPFMSNCDSKNPNPNRAASATQGLVGFIGVGDDTGEGDVLYAIPDSDFNSGYHVGANDSFIAWADIVNYNKEATKIYLAYEIEYAPGIIGVNTRDVLLSVTGCNMKAIKTSTLGPTNTTSEKWVFYEDGNLVIARRFLALASVYLTADRRTSARGRHEDGHVSQRQVPLRVHGRLRPRGRRWEGDDQRDDVLQRPHSDQEGRHRYVHRAVRLLKAQAV
jgi:hypothetical protein